MSQSKERSSNKISLYTYIYIYVYERRIGERRIITIAQQKKGKGGRRSKKKKKLVGKSSDTQKYGKRVMLCKQEKKRREIKKQPSLSLSSNKDVLGCREGEKKNSFQRGSVTLSSEAAWCGKQKKKKTCADAANKSSLPLAYKQQGEKSSCNFNNRTVRKGKKKATT